MQLNDDKYINKFFSSFPMEKKIVTYAEKK
jgi:hypothetical protein